MSQEQVEVVRAHIEAFRSQDAARTLSFLDPHVVLDVSRTGGDEEAIYGRAAIAEFMRRMARWLAVRNGQPRKSKGAADVLTSIVVSYLRLQRTLRP